MRLVARVLQHRGPLIGPFGMHVCVRYDARGYLHSIGEYEPKPGAALQYAASLSEEERAIEDLCEEERFLALFRDLHEESIYQEEELKRLNIAMNADGTYKETAFSYDSENSAQDMQDTQDEAEIPFKAPKGLHIPVSVPTPSTMKQHAIIEKTALFVSQHGAQMEILVKTKQAGNAQFGFLSFDDPLNVYYRFLVEQLKCGTYVPPAQHSTTGNEESDDDDDHYLHPSLFAASTPAVPTVVSKVFLTKEGEDNAYLQLIKNLKPQLDSPSGGASPCPPQEAEEAANHGAAYGYGDGAGYEDYSQPPPPPGLEPILLPSQAVLTGYAIPPPPDVQPIIDKMAVYVAKNGEDFETIVKSKGDKRFEFLLPEHEYHRYYLHKKQAYLDEKAREAAAAAKATEPEEPAKPVTTEDGQPSATEDLPDKEADRGDESDDDEHKGDGVVGPKLKNGLSIVGDGLGSGSDSPFSNIDSNDASSLLEAATHGERSYNKGPVSFSLKLKDSEGKEKKRVALGADESDSEEQAEGAGVPAASTQQEDTKAEDNSSSSKDSSSNKDKKPEGGSSTPKDRLSPGRQLQLERKKRLAKFLSMIKDAPPVTTAPTSEQSEGPQQDASKGSSGASTPREAAGRLADVQRAPTDSLPGSPSIDTGRERGSNDRQASAPAGASSPPRSSKSHKSSSKTRHRSRSPPSRHRHRHHHHGREEPARSRSRERHHRSKHHRSSPRHSHLKRSHSKSPSPARVKRSRSRRSRTRSPVRRK